MLKRKNITGVQVHSDKLRIWFMYNGERCFESLNLSPLDANQRAAAKLRKEICEKIRHGIFDYASYFPNSARATKILSKKTLTFEVMSDLWLSDQTHLTKSTIDGYRKSLNFHWLPELGERPIDSITYTELKSLILTRKFKTGKTRNNSVIPLRGIFAAAYYDEIISSNPAARIIYVKHQRKDPDPLFLDEIELVLKYIEEHYPASIHNYFEFAFFAGLRTSEQIELRWEDVDLKRKVIYVQRAKVSQEINNHTKTHVAREIELNCRAYTALEHQHLLTSTQTIFLNEKTKKSFIGDKPLRLIWTQVLKNLNMRHRACYQTRHTCATLMLMSGVNPAWAANQLGHSMHMFLGTYARWIRKADNGRELAKLDLLLNKP
jgi:integrase